METCFFLVVAVLSAANSAMAAATAWTKLGSEAEALSSRLISESLLDKIWKPSLWVGARRHSAASIQAAAAAILSKRWSPSSREKLLAGGGGKVDASPCSVASLETATWPKKASQREPL
jgi:hypothetical protein